MKLKIASVTLLLIFAAGCSSKAQDGKVVAEVNGKKATLDYVLAQFPTEYKDKLSAEDIDKAIQSWIELEILYQEAVRQNLEKDPRVQYLIDQARKTIVARRFLEQAIGDRVDVTDSEIAAFYERESDRFTSSEEAVNLSHIVLRSEGAAQAVYKRLLAGDDFAQLARDYSEDTSTIRSGGEIGFLPLASLEKEMIDEINTTAVGKFTKPLRSRSGAYHIFRLNDRRSSGTTVPLAEVHDDIAQAILAEKQQIAFDSIITALRGKAKIQVFPIGDSLGKK